MGGGEVCVCTEVQGIRELPEEMVGAACGHTGVYTKEKGHWDPLELCSAQPAQPSPAALSIPPVSVCWLLLPLLPLTGPAAKLW